MPTCIPIPDDLRKRLEVLKPLINFFAGLEFESDEKYIEFLLNLAINKILTDVLSDPESRLDLIKMIFREEPELVVKNLISLLSEEYESTERKSKTSPEAPMHT